MTRLSLTLFGGFAVTLDGEPVLGFDSNKVRALLAYLAVESGRAHRRESLAALLWPGYPDRSARTNLRNALANLRTAIGDREAEPPFLLITRETLQFNRASDHRLDVALLEDALSSAERVPTDQLAEAADLYTGDFLAGFTLEDAVGFDDWASITGERLRRQALELLGELVDRLTADGDAERAVTYARRRVELEPWREDAQRQLIRLLMSTGQRSAALRQIRECERVLREELDAAPSAATVALREDIRAGDGVLEPGGASPFSMEAEPPALGPHSLPPTPMPLIGREALLAQVGGYLRDQAQRLVTLVGPGGSGKTRLAIAVGRSQLPLYRDGVHFVELAALQSPRGVWSAIAKGSGFVASPAQPGQTGTPLPEQLIAYLREKQVLLVLDNAEQLLSASGDDGLRGIIAALLSAAPRVTVLVTSRERLRMLHEQVVPITGIGFESTSRDASELELTPAAQLFVQGARRISPSFSVSSGHRAEVDIVCRAVQGMPLAILLAASWVDVLSPGEIAEQLVGTEGEGLGFLTADWADVPDRHRSLTAVFDGSWGLLIPVEQDGFAALSIFRGSFTRQSAKAVAGMSLGVLRSLVAKSLVQVEGERYRLHALLREYAAEKLVASGRLDVVAECHGQHYADRVAQWSEQLKGYDRATALAEMDSESEDTIEAWDWAADRGSVDLLLRMLEGLREYLDWRDRDSDALPGIQRGIDRLVSANSSASRQPDSVRVLLAYLYGWLSWFADTADVQQELVQKGQRALGPDQREMPSWRRCRAWLSLQSGHAASRRGDHHLALTRAEAARDDYRSAGDRWWQARALQTMGVFAVRKGDFEFAESLCMEALGLYRALGDGYSEIALLISLGGLRMRLGDFVRARQFFAQGLVGCQCVRDHRLELNARTYLGLTQLWQGEYAAGEAALVEARSGFRDLGVPFMVSMTAAAIAFARLQQGDYATACLMAEEGLREAEHSGWDYAAARHCRAWGQALLAYGDLTKAADLLDKAVALYAVGEADERADTRAILAIARLRQGQTGAACSLIQTALELFEQAGATNVAEYPLSAAALLLAHAGVADVGLTLYAAALAGLPQVANGRWFEDVVGSPLRAVVHAALSPAVYAAAEVRGRLLTVGEGIRLARTTLTVVFAGYEGPDTERPQPLVAGQHDSAL